MLAEELKIQKIQRIWEAHSAKKLLDKEEKLKKKKTYYIKRNKDVPKEECLTWQKQNPKRFLKWQILNKWKASKIKDEFLDDIYECFINQKCCWMCDVQYNNNYLLKQRTLYIDKNGDPELIICWGCKLQEANLTTG